MEAVIGRYLCSETVSNAMQMTIILHTVTDGEFQRRLEEYQDLALVSPIVVTRDGRERLVLLSAEEYRRLNRLGRHVVASGQFSDDDIASIAATEVPAEHAYLNSHTNRHSTWRVRVM